MVLNSFRFAFFVVFIRAELLLQTLRTPRGIWGLLLRTTIVLATM